MGTKAQQAVGYQRLPGFLRTLRDEAGLTQHELERFTLALPVAAFARTRGRAGAPAFWRTRLRGERATQS